MLLQMDVKKKLCGQTQKYGGSIENLQRCSQMKAIQQKIIFYLIYNNYNIIEVNLLDNPVT